MTVIVEDGTGVANANSYIAEVMLTDWATARGLSLGTALTPENLIHQSMDYLEGLDYQGSKTSESQSLSWPRSGVTVNGVSIADNLIPVQLITSQLQLCYQISQGNNPLETTGQAVKKEKVDSIEVEYQDGTSSSTELVAVNASLNLLLANVSGGASYIAELSI